MFPEIDSLGRARLRRALRIVAIVLAVWLVATAVLLFFARQKVNDGLDQLQTARGQLTAEQLLRGQGLGALEAAQRDFNSAHSLSSNLVLAPWSIVPLISNNTTAVKDLTGAARQVAAVGATAARDGSDALKTQPTTPAGRLALLDRLAAIAARAQRDLNGITTGPDFFLIGPLGSARTRFLDRLTKLRTAVADAEALVAGTERVLRGPSHYLALAANNGEMRNGSGMFLSAGLVTFDNGSFTVSQMGPSADHDLPPGAVPVPPELAPLWGWLNPSQHWRNLASSPRFDVTARLAANMWQASTGQTVDGVLAVDAQSLSALLAAQGPIQVGGQQFSAGDVVSYLLLGQYAGIPAVTASQEDRRDQLSAIAQASVESLSGRPWNGPELVQNLSNTGKGRHVLAWASDPNVERAWEAAGVAGELHSDSLAISVMNFGGNKLDQFLQINSTLSIAAANDGGSDANLTVDLHNDVPTGLPGYVAGPYPGSGVGEGTYQGILAVNVPGSASGLTLQGISPVLARGPDGPTQAIAGGYLQIPKGETLRAVLRFHLAPGVSEMTLEPSARIPPGHLQFRTLKTTDQTAEHLRW